MEASGTHAKDATKDATGPFSQPQKEHQWLQRLVGEWTYEAEAAMGPGESPQRSTGTESVRSLGGIWILAEGRGEMPGGGDATTLMTLGYDPRTNRYVGTWVGSMMSHMWVYDGSLDPAERVLTLDTEGPDMAGAGKLARYRDAIEFVSNDHRVLRASVLREDGSWHEFMVAHYRRTG